MPFKFADAYRVAKSVKYSDAQRFAKHVVPEVVRPARIIWNQAIGAVFFVIAIFALPKMIDLYRNLATKPDNKFGLALSFFFVSIMVGFGTASFLKARKIGRPRSSRP